VAAFLRAETDIPYCRDIARLCGAEAAAKTFFGEAAIDLENRRALIELRFKSLTAIIRILENKQVLELGGGFSSRGLILSEDPSMNIVETDLPEIIEEKLAIVEKIVPLRERPNYHLRALDIFFPKAFWDAVGCFGLKPITIAHEGLLQFQPAPKKERLAKIIRSLFRLHGGAWVTPDVVTREYFSRFYTSAEQVSALEKAAAATGQNLIENCFTNEKEALDFFETAGFTVERLKQIHLAPDMRNHIRDARLTERIGYEEIWIMRLRKKIVPARY